ncbi:transketolase-like [Petromyzon marinus]|nr:transketolase-like [Petromyzon marinus]
MAAQQRLPSGEKLQALRDTANRLRIHSIRATCASNSGHPTSCCSAAEIMSTLFFYGMKYKADDPGNVNNDRFVLSKGHAAPVLYAAWTEAGYIAESDLLNLRKIDSDLEGHPTPKLSFVDVATGSLGQGLGAACGMAYTGKNFDKASYRVYCLLGDGESSEGSVWEAMAFGSHYNLDNLVAIFDVNRLGQSEAAPLQHNFDIYKSRCEGFGWNTLVVDGHSVEELCQALLTASQTKGKPTAIIAKTFKGKGIPGVEDQDNWHGKPIPKDKVEEVVQVIQKKISNATKLCPELPTEDAPVVDVSNVKLSTPPSYKLGDKISTRKAYGVALNKLGHGNSHVIALDGDTKNSTFSDMFRKDFPDRFIECFIAEQNMVSVAIGCAARGRTVPFASTFAAFLSRAYDQIRMGAISQTNVNFCGSHCGVSIGEDGPSQMALEDLAMFRAIPTATVFYPSDGVSTERAVELSANTKGICFIRSSRPDTDILYANDEKFEIGKAKVVLKSESDKVTVIGAGVTLHEALAAAKTLASEGLNVRVIDPFTIKPLDKKMIVENVKATGGRVVVVEDHYPEGGLGEAVCAAVSSQPGIVVRHLAVPRVPQSGKPTELLELFGISSSHIVATVKAFVLGN